MKNKTMLTLSALILWAAMGSTQAFNKDEKKEIESIISEYIVEHPEVLVKAMQRLEQIEQQRTASAAFDIQNKLRTSSDHYSLGKSSAKHVIVEFYDYNCGYCKVMEPMFKKALKDYDLQIIYVNVPVISEESRQIAVVAQALFSYDKEKFVKFHEYFMKPGKHDGKIDALKDLCKSIDVDFDEIVKVMQSQKPQSVLSQNMAWASELKLAGTPYLIIDGNEFRGAITSEEMLKKILVD